jgi:hypothetical protein
MIIERLWLRPSSERLWLRPSSAERLWAPLILDEQEGDTACQLRLIDVNNLEIWLVSDHIVIRQSIFKSTKYIILRGCIGIAYCNAQNYMSSYCICRRQYGMLVYYLPVSNVCI